MRVVRSFDASMSSQKDYNIATTTDVKQGQLVKLVGGLVVPCAVGETTAILGICEENHTGTVDTFNVRNNGTSIRVSDSPTTVFEAPAPIATATSGSATTMAATGLAAFADNDFAGGFIKLVSKTVASANTDPIGKVYAVTASTAATKLFTVASGGTHTAGDIYEIYPPTGFSKGNLDATIGKLVLTATAALPIRSYGEDTNRGVTYHIPSLHINGSKQS